MNNFTYDLSCSMTSTLFTIFFSHPFDTIKVFKLINPIKNLYSFVLNSIFNE